MKDLIKDLSNILWGDRVYFPGLYRDKFEYLYDEGATLGTLFIGRPGEGKTEALANHTVRTFREHPDRAIFIIDWSGSISDDILLQLNDDDLKRVIYDEMCHPDWAYGMPELVEPYEENVQRVARNMRNLAPNLVQLNPTVGGLALEELAPEIFRMCTAIRNEYDECWQVTEVKRLLSEDKLLVNAMKNYGDKVPNARYYLQYNYLNLPASDKTLRRHAITSMMGAFESREGRARAGGYKSAWTVKEAIEKSFMVIINAFRLINEPLGQNFFVTSIFSRIIQELNKRIPNDPNNKPVVIVLDETYALTGIPGMAKEIPKIPSLYRGRDAQLYVVHQSLSQLAPELRQQIWSLGNVVCFGISDFEEAYEIAQQLFKYEPKTVKMPAKSETGQPIIEPDRGQYLAIANWIQRLNHRECIIRRYISEQQLDPYVRHVPRTKDTPPTRPYSELPALKERLLKERGTPTRDMLEEINKRTLGPGGTPPQAL